jgi:transcriptional regulator with XRE-family HTH domain
MEERVSGVPGARHGEDFAALLRELKDRSGLSYGVLATRLHMSTSTLHRYCHGTAVPNDYAPVERLARLCRATPQELVELHRRWVLADAARGLGRDQAAAARAAEAGAGEVAAERGTGPRPMTATGSAAAAEPTASGEPTTSGEPANSGGPTAFAPSAGSASSAASAGSAAPGGSTASAGSTAPGEPAAPTSVPGGDGDPDAPLVTRVTRGLIRPPRRRNALIASAAVAAVLVAAVLAVQSPWSDGGDDTGDQQAAGVAVTTTSTTEAAPSATPSTSRPSRTPSAPATTARPRTSGPGVSKTTPASGTTAGSGGGSRSNAVPLAVNVRPYAYDPANPCSQHFLVDSPPAHVGPPASEQDAPHWAAVYGAVSSDEEEVALTVQGTGSDTVVLNALHVRVIAEGAPLAWNDYSMATGCGGPVDTKSFDIDLDRSSTTVTVKGGQRNFPYKVSESDPEVFYVIAHTKAYDVRWDLTLDWSSGDRSGSVQIDNQGAPFRTSADVNRPGYDYPPGYSDWIKRES